MNVKKQWKRWIALILVWVVVATLLPESFTSTVGAQAGEISEEITLTFQWSETDCGQDVEFVLYELDEEKNELTGTDAIYEEEATGTDVPSAAGVKVTTIKSVNSLIVKLSGLDDTKTYAYQVVDSTLGAAKKLIHGLNLLNTANTNQEIQLTAKDAGGFTALNMNVKQNIVTNQLSVNYAIYAAVKNDESYILGTKIAENTVNVGNTGTAKVENVSAEYGSYAIVFSGTNVSSENIYYADVTENICVFGTEQEPIEIKAVDNTAPVITFQYPESEVTSTDAQGKNYYKESRTVDINVVEDGSFDPDKFEEAVTEAISHVSQTAYTINKQDDKNYRVKFIADGEYTLKVQYTDNYNNQGISEEVKFTVDGTAPIATAAIGIGKYDAVALQEVAAVGSWISTNLRTMGTLAATEFHLTDISDGENGAGIGTVEYVLTEDVVDTEKAIEALTGWETAAVIEGAITPVSVSQTDGTKDKKYYIYYKLTDKLGNVSYVDGLGFELDNTAPVITYTYENMPNISTEGVNTFSGLSAGDKETVTITVEDKNIVPDASNYKVMVNESDKTVNWQYGSGKATATVDCERIAGATTKYEIVTECKDELNIPAVHTETVIIDDKAPTAIATVGVGTYTATALQILGADTATRLSTNLRQDKNNQVSEFYLSSIDDESDGAGIDSVEYMITNTQVQSSEDMAALEGWERASLTQDKTGIDPIIVSETDPDKDGTYYIYYKLVDNIGNIAYISGLDFVLDNTSPVISYAYGADEIISDDSNGIYTFSGDTQITLNIAESNFAINDENVTVSVKKNGEVYTEFTQPVWAAVSGGASASITLPEENNTTVTYEITVTCKDEADIPASHTESIIIDKTAPIVSAVFADTDEVKDNGYFAARTVTYTVEETDSLSAEDFKISIETALTGIATDAYTISEWDAQTHSYTVRFTADGGYSIANVVYKDKCGNVNANESTEATFSIDNTAPTAGFMVQLFNYNDETANEAYTGVQTSWTAEEFAQLSSGVKYYATCFGEGTNAKNTSMVLQSIYDNLSGIAHVAYYLKNGAPLEAGTELSGIAAADWTEAGVEQFSENGSKMTVSLAGMDTSEYYIYYKITDYAGNVTFYNGAGIILDQGNPEISDFVYGTDASVSDAAGHKYTFSDNVSFTVNVTEDYFNGEDYASVTVKKNGGEEAEVSGENITWTYDADKKTATGSVVWKEGTSLYTVEGISDTYELTIKSRDMVDRESSHTETVTIDRKLPVITVTDSSMADDTNKKGDHYYKGSRAEKITVEEDSVDPAALRQTIVDGVTVTDILGETMVDQESIADTEIDTALIVRDAEQKALYTISAWNNTDKSYTVTYQADAIYEVAIDYADRCGNSNNGNIIATQEDWNNFVIDSAAPEITLSYDDAGKNSTHYYNGSRNVTITVKDLSYVYKKLKMNDETPVTDQVVTWAVSAKDAKSADVENAYSTIKTGETADSGWTFTDETGAYTRTVYFNADAIYGFEITGTEDFSGNAVGTSTINYGEDGKSFVIDREAPVVTVTYDDENMQQEHYYAGTRTETITISDLSYAYAQTYEEADNDNGIKNAKLEISASNQQGDSIENAYTDTDWLFDNGVYTRSVVYGTNGTTDVDAIYDVTLNVTDVYKRDTESSVDSFVIDRAAPVVTVTYDETNKKKDHYYTGTRTETITVSDLSYAYGYRQGDNANGIDHTQLTIGATNQAGSAIENAYTEAEWTLEDGNLVKSIVYGINETTNVDAIYNTGLSVTDVYERVVAPSVDSFVIDRAAPVVTVEYDDAAKKQEHYYEGTRTAVITVDDLSYAYADRVSENKDAINQIHLEITAQDEANNAVLNAYTDTHWSFTSGIYTRTVTYGTNGMAAVDAIYGTTLTGTDVYERDAVVSYVDEGVAVTDASSFVIDRAAPVVTVEYDDAAKKQEHYYEGTRTAVITVKDLSYTYADNMSETKDAINQIDLEITTQDEAKNVVLNAYTDTGWSFTGGTYTKTVTYGTNGTAAVDAIYDTNLTGMDVYERDAVVSYVDEGVTVTDAESFVIDRNAPVVNVVYDDTNQVTERFYKGTRTAKLTISDLSYVYEDIQRKSGVTPENEERVIINITGLDMNQQILTEAEEQTDWEYNDSGVYEKNIRFKNDAIYSYEMGVKDIYERDGKITYRNAQKEVTDYASFVLDTHAPEVTITYDDTNRGRYVGYYKGDRTATIKATDLSFIYQDMILNGLQDTLYLNQEKTEDSFGYVDTNITVTNDDLGTDITNNTDMFEKNNIWTLTGSTYEKVIIFKGEGHYGFTVTGQDICGYAQEADYSEVADAKNFWIDLTDPTISVTYDDTTPTRTVGGREYYNNSRTATIVITEGVSTFKSEDVVIGITAVDAAGRSVAGTSSQGEWIKTTDNQGVTTHTGKITYNGNANYNFDISYQDMAGRDADDFAVQSFTVDKEAPTGSVTVGNLGTWNYLVANRTFGLWSNVAVNVNAAYNDMVSSVHSVRYYKTASTSALTVAQLNALSSGQWSTYNPFEVRPNEQFTVYLRIEDCSGNVTYISTDGIILDTTAPAVEDVAPEITVAPVQPVNGIYNSDVTVDINVSDPVVNDTYSGLKAISYQVLNMGVVTQEGELYDFGYENSKPVQAQLVQNWRGQIVVDRTLNNSNDVRIVVYAQDNSNNSASGANVIQIDITQPDIDISYDNNDGDTSFGEATYFQADRTATISITERNFNPDNVVITLTNTDGVIPTLSSWTTYGGTGNGDDIVHRSTLSYTADGDYNFDISYADMAGNGNTAVDYGNSLAPQVFTIDKTVPVINVAYNNNSAQNGNYYSAARTATISIDEHNFETGRYTITTTASDDGNAKTAPTISGWANNGDIHTATVQFNDDGYYTIGMAYTDMAGNQAAAFAEQNFYVDQTMPAVTLRGIRNLSANNSDVIGFEITCTDTNFDIFQPALTVTRLIDGKNVSENYDFDNRADIKNGAVYTIENLPNDGIYSLVCTIYDKAGNAFNRIIYLDEDGQEISQADVLSEDMTLLAFSVNRGGSTFALKDYAAQISSAYYVQSVEDDIVVIETNVDDLNEYSVDLNDESLEENTDFTVEKSGGNNEWYVKRYVINKELFQKEGEYHIVVNSIDAASNTAYSDIKGTEISFVVDKTAPEVTVSGVETDGRYQVESQIVNVIPKDDGGKLQKLTIEILDEDDNALDGYPITYEGEELQTSLDDNDGMITFAIPEGTRMSVQISCEDMAGNDIDTLTFENIVVSTSGLTIFVANKPLFYGTIAGVVGVIVIGSVAVVLGKKKKSGSNRMEEN